VWLTRFAQCGLDLLAETADPERWPQARCTGEEVIIAMAEHRAGSRDRTRIIDLREYLCEDIDVEMLFDVKQDGIEHSEEWWVEQMRFVALKPDEWFDWFGHVEPRR
jgi:hypothetical protein